MADQVPMDFGMPHRWVGTALSVGVSPIWILTYLVDGLRSVDRLKGESGDGQQRNVSNIAHV